MDKLIYTSDKPYEVRILRTRYPTTDRHAIVLQTEDDDLFKVSTMNIPTADLTANEVVIKNHSENSGMLAFLIENNVVEVPHRWITSNHTAVPVCHLIIE